MKRAAVAVGLEGGAADKMTSACNPNEKVTPVDVTVYEDKKRSRFLCCERGCGEKVEMWREKHVSKLAVRGNRGVIKESR